MEKVEITNIELHPEGKTATTGTTVVTLTKEEKEQSSSTGSSMKDLESYEMSLKTLQNGQYVKGKIVRIDKEGILVDVGFKSEGLIPPHEITNMDIQGTGTAVKVGDEIDVVVIRVNDAEGELILSKKRADLEFAWKSIINAFETQEVITATCIEQVRGGLIVDIGLRGFIPASHIDVRPVRDLGDFVGEALRLKVIELDRARRKVVLSRRKVLEEERESSRDSTLKNLYEGEIRKGKIARITNFGAFVNLGGVDGLIHISELSWSRIKHPSEVIKVGDEVEVLVLKMDAKKEKISLSLRQAKPDPWLIVKDRFITGSIIEGKVSKLAKNYAFVELTEGIEGLIPIAELSEERVTKPEDVLKLNQKLSVKIIDVRPEERRIILSLKLAQAEASKGEYSEYMAPRGKSTLGDILKSKMEEKELQGIIGVKNMEEKPPVSAASSGQEKKQTEAAKPTQNNSVSQDVKSVKVEETNILSNESSSGNNVSLQVNKESTNASVHTDNDKKGSAPAVASVVSADGGGAFAAAKGGNVFLSISSDSQTQVVATSSPKPQEENTPVKKENMSSVERLIQDAFSGKLDDTKKDA